MIGFSIMGQAKIIFDENIDERAFLDLKDLDQFLDEVGSAINSEDPIIVTIMMHASIVSLGLGLDSGFVQVINESNEPPYWITLGDEEVDGEVDFYLHGKHHTEISRRHLMPIEEVRNIVREFYRTGLRSKNVSWVEV